MQYNGTAEVAEDPRSMVYTPMVEKGEEKKWEKNTYRCKSQ